MTSREELREAIDMTSFYLYMVVEAWERMGNDDNLNMEYAETVPYLPSFDEFANDFMEFTRRARAILDNNETEK